VGAILYSPIAQTKYAVSCFLFFLSAKFGVRRGGVYRVLVGKQEGRRPLGRPRRRWVDNIRMDLQEVGCGYMDGMGWPRIEIGGGRL